jgi:transcriptional regulator with XRE-family HTH domain
VPKTIKPKPINWIAVRAEYEAGGISLRQLADKLGVGRRTIERRCSKESWVQHGGNMAAEVAAEVSKKIRNEIITKRVEKTLDDLDIINEVIGITHNYIVENPDNFKTTGEAIASLDRMQKIKFEYSKERIEKWLYDNGLIAVPIAELSPQNENRESSNTV